MLEKFGVFAFILVSCFGTFVKFEMVHNSCDQLNSYVTSELFHGELCQYSVWRFASFGAARHCLLAQTLPHDKNSKPFSDNLLPSMLHVTAIDQPLDFVPLTHDMRAFLGHSTAYM